MAHQSGTADTFQDLLNQLCTFLAGQGWTVNYNAAEGSGRRAHVSKDSVHANFRAFSNEYRFGQSSANNAASPFGADYQHYGLSMNLSTSAGSSSGQWDQQTGAPQNSASKYLAVEMRGPLGTTGNIYHFYAHAGTDQFLVEFEDKANPGTWQHLASGILDKTGAGTYTGGEWFSGSNCCQTTAYKLMPLGTSTVAAEQNFFVRVDFTATAPSTDSFTGWLGFSNGTSGATWTGKGVVSSAANPHANGQTDAGGVPNCFPNYGYYTSNTRLGLPYLQDSQVSTIQTLLGYQLFMNRGTLSGRKGFSLLGTVAKIYPANLMLHAPADVIVIGATNYHLFPANKLGEGMGTGTGANGVTYYKSDYLGIAVEE